jgi:phage tail-like protein
MSLTSPGLTVFFTVTIEAGFDLGAWSTLTGLGMELKIRERDDSAITFFQHHIPGHVNYPHITLTRPVNESSTEVLNWLSAYHLMPIPTTGEIACVDQTGAPIVTWQMVGVTPVKWTGPEFHAERLDASTEKLEIAHMGFL